MNSRVNRDELNLTIAGLIALRSECNRLKVGAVATIDGRIVATGYNNRLGRVKCNDENCTEALPCTGTVHAEQNLIAFAARHGVRLEKATLYCTHQPCLSCAQSIIQAGIERVVFIRPYRLPEGLLLLGENGVNVEMAKKFNIVTQYIHEQTKDLS